MNKNIPSKILIGTFFLIFIGCKNKVKSTFENRPHKGEYTIATYNVRYKNKGDDKKGHSWSERKKHIINLVRKYNFDIFGVQEPFEGQINDMISDLTEYQRFGVSDDNVPNSISSHHHDIFYKSSKFDLKTHGEFWLSPSAPTSPPENIMTAAWGGKAKVCTWGKFQDKFTNDIFYVFNSHFFYANETTRINSSKIVLDKIKKIAGNSPVIFMGDLNFSQYSKGYKILQKSNILIDSYSLATTVFPVNDSIKHQTFNHWLTQPKTSFKTGERIDYIFLSNHWKNKVNSNTIIWDSYLKDGIEKMPSDHNAVMIKLEKL